MNTPLNYYDIRTRRIEYTVDRNPWAEVRSRDGPREDKEVVGPRLSDLFPWMERDVRARLYDAHALTTWRR